MASSKQIAWRKKFAKLYGKKKKGSKSKKVIRKLSDPDTVIGGNFGKLRKPKKKSKQKQRELLG